MDKIKILFLCTGASCRSQMAKGFANHIKRDVLQAWCAGTDPHGINKNAVAVMNEAGVDISGSASEQVDDLMAINFDYVVTVCDGANENCPVLPGNAKVVHYGFDDPPKLAKDAKTVEEALDHYRRVRDEIKVYVQTLPYSLTKG